MNKPYLKTTFLHNAQYPLQKSFHIASNLIKIGGYVASMQFQSDTSNKNCHNLKNFHLLFLNIEILKFVCFRLPHPAWAINVSHQTITKYKIVILLLGKWFYILAKVMYVLPQENFIELIIFVGKLKTNFWEHLVMIKSSLPVLVTHLF